MTKLHGIFIRIDLEFIIIIPAKTIMINANE